MKQPELLSKLRKRTGALARRLGVLSDPWHGTHQGSFKQHQTEILRGNVPERYKELASHVPGNRILDIGSADGTLALHMATMKEHVYGIEPSKTRHRTACKVQKAWGEIGIPCRNCTFHNNDVFSLTDVFKHVDTVTFIRVLYHLKEGAQQLFDVLHSSKNIQYVVLCGNSKKEQRLANGEQLTKLGAFADLATESGMSAFIQVNGFKIEHTVRLESTNDFLLVGKR